MARKQDAQGDLAKSAAEETFHRREWRAQRIGWGVLAAVLVAACAGLFGNGPLAHSTVVAGSASLKIDRFARRDGPTQWIFQTKTASAQSDLKLEISSSLLQRVKIQSIIPEPQDQIATAKGVLFIFHPMASGAQIVFDLEPQYVGWTAGELQLNDSAPVMIQQFVYP